MKNIVLILSFSITLTVFGQAYPDSGFTNKAEAKNLVVNGMKEGKWIEYKNEDWKSTKDTNSSNYELIVYKADKPYGITRGYAKSKLFYETPYIDGKANGLQKIFYEDGKVKVVFPCSEGKHNGLAKQYYESGKLEGEVLYTNGTINGEVKWYYENGKLQSEITYTNGVKGATRNYDTNGNEIK
ncbi:MAG: hypothetical protein HKL88_02775 [Bacteroidia bacterium]|jgi:antitoxin component YwqK of YwqJK toxin-antitoxin module|nr:hypothetical protein [Bacteroidia bacterium]